MKIDKIAEDIRALFEESIDSSQSCGVEYTDLSDIVAVTIYEESEEVEYDLDNIDKSLIEVAGFIISKSRIYIDHLNKDYKYDIDLKLFQNILDVFN